MLMTWTGRIMVAVPFMTATVLTVLTISAHRLHLRREHIAGYGFLFFTLWAWLLNHVWFGNVHSRLLQSMITYAVVLWMPAILYSACLWLFLRLLGVWARRIRG
jgi:hypothetical protein